MNKYYYMAGLLDGEGTIGIARHRAAMTFKSPYISMSSTTPEIMEFCKDNFGGHISTHKVYQDHHKRSWSWKLKNMPQIYELLTHVEPIMLEPEKVRRAQLILWEYPYVTVRNGKYSEEQRLKKMEFEARFADPSVPINWNL